MNTRYLAIFATLAFLGFTVPAAAHHCEDHPNAKGHCANPDPSDPDATFEVKVYFTRASASNLAGTVDEGDGKSNGQRRSVTDPSLMLNTTALNGDLPGGDCMIATFGIQTAQFALSTYKNKQSGDFTFVSGNFFNINAGTGVDYALEFRPGSEVNPVMEDSGDGWLPSGGTTRVTGNLVRLRAQKGVNADDDCNVDIGIVWIFDVSDN